jgi:hypothetical protein
MTNRSRRGVAMLVCTLLAGACEYTFNNNSSGTGTGTGSGTGTGGNPTGPSPTPTPTPTPAPAPTFRTPDPPAGSFLPLPTYGLQTLNTVSVDPAAHCLDFGFIDAVVDALRLRDTRWGYMCRGVGCSQASMDKIAYHATAGPDVAGALGVWVVDIIGSACEAPTRQWGVDGFDAAAGWTGRGRF